MLHNLQLEYRKSSQRSSSSSVPVNFIKYSPLGSDLGGGAIIGNNPVPVFNFS